MLEIDGTEQRINYLSNEITRMYMTRADTKKLGKLAIQIMTTRVNLENVLEGKYSREEKNKAQKMLKKIKEIERRAVSLFLMSRIATAKTRDALGSFYEYIQGEYKREELIE